ncbi:MAG: RluA family pseudouridine synthase [Phycisphaerales bacterium]|nr:RluA family pseudouridine synthase [Phycisphaerales bacterium]
MEPIGPSEPDDDGSPLSLLPSDPDRAVASGSADDDAPNRVVFVLQRDLQKRLDKYLTDRIPFMSRTQLQRLIDEGGVTINGRPPKASTRVALNDRVEVFIPPPPPSEVQPEDIAIDVLFEDEHIIVLNKRPDIIVHPARSHNKGTLINALAHHFQHKSPSGGSLSTVGKEFARPGVVHRLDRDTSGVIVFAKDDTAHWRLARQFELRTVDKRYLALAHGLVEPDIEVIDKPIGPHPSRQKGYREKYVVRHDYLGKPSVTICRVRARFVNPGGDPASRFSLVELELKTGRTHQIRVHLSHGGYPIVGDDMYGGRVLRRADFDRAANADSPPILARQALHAATLAFRHPISDRPMSFAAPLPTDMGESLAALARMDRSAAPLSPPGSTYPIDRIWPATNGRGSDANPAAM